MLTNQTTKVTSNVTQTEFLDDVTSPPAGTILLYGIAHKPDGTLYVCNLPTTQNTYARGKLLVREDGVLIVNTTGTRVANDGPFQLTGDGELLVSTGTVSIFASGFGFDGDGNLVVSATS